MLHNNVLEAAIAHILKKYEIKEILYEFPSIVRSRA